MRFELALASSSTGVDVFDVHSGTILRSINIQNSQGSLATLGDEHFIIFQSDKAVMQIWSWKTGTMKLRSLAPEKLTAIIVSHDQNYVAAGAASGKVYLWSMSDGDLLNCWQAHYKNVSALCFTADDSFLLTGGDDAVVNAWLFDSTILEPPAHSTEPPCPWVEWPQHSLPVTGLYCGVGGMAGRVVSSSLDRTCKIFDLPSKSMLHSFVFPCLLNAVVLDPAEHFLLAAGGDGKIHKVGLLGPSGGLGAAAPAAPNQNKGHHSFEGHERAVTALSLSFNGAVLLSSSLDGTAAIWDSETGQLLRRLTKNRPHYLGGHIVQDAYGLLGTSTPQPTKSSKLLATFFPFKRFMADTLEMDKFYRVRLKGVGDADPRASKRRAIVDQRAHADFRGEEADGGTQSKLVELNTSNDKLKAELDRWKALHGKLYAFCSETLLRECDATNAT